MAALSGRWTTLWWAGLVATVTVALTGALLLSYVDGDATYCALDGADSNYGVASLSLFPPGPECTYTRSLNGVDRVDGPGPATSIWLATLIIAGTALIWTRHAHRD